jgi:hypothetical protein
MGSRAPSGANRLTPAPVLESRLYRAALAAGATDEGKPGGREEYSEAYYGCFVRDLDGHRIEATHWDASRRLACISTDRAWHPALQSCRTSGLASRRGVR